MPFPLISEYIEAIKSAEDNFKELTNLRPVLDDDGQPIMTSGNFAVVFKMKDIETGKFYALKCFTKEQEGREEAYHQIAEELECVESPFLISIQYLDKDLFVDTDQTTETEFPVLLMDWVEGKTLDKYLRENLDDKYALEMLAYRFSLLAQWLIPQPFAHGDLKPDNILVRENGTLVLVDYDGMYVPAMKGQKARELGSPDFRHPQRTDNDFDEHIDEFPLVSILLSLKAISIEPFLLTVYGTDNRLLFSEKNYNNISEHKLLKDISFQGNDYLDLLIACLVVSIANKYWHIQDIYKKLELKIPTIDDLLSEGEISLGVDYALKYINWGKTYRDFESAMIHEWGDEVQPYLTSDFHKAIAFSKLSTECTNNDVDNGVVEKGILYSKDKKRVLSYYNFQPKHIIEEGTLVVCDGAFSDIWSEIDNYYVDRIVIPKSVIKIGANPFGGYISSIECRSPFFEIIDDILYNKRPSNIKLIQCFNRFDDSERSNNCVVIPEGVYTIGERSFYDCYLDSITIPHSVREIEKNPFISVNTLRNKPLEIICLSERFKVYDYGLYDNNRKTLISYFGKNNHFEVIEGTKIIGNYAFWWCSTLKSISLPSTIELIENDSFCGTWESLDTIFVPSGYYDHFKKMLPYINIRTILKHNKEKSYRPQQIKDKIRDLFNEIRKKHTICINYFTIPFANEAKALWIPKQIMDKYSIIPTWVDNELHEQPDAIRYTVEGEFSNISKPCMFDLHTDNEEDKVNHMVEYLYNILSDMRIANYFAEGADNLIMCFNENKNDKTINIDYDSIIISKEFKILLSIERQIALDTIAESLAIDFDEMLDVIEDFIDRGMKLNIDYFLDEVMDADIIAIIYDYFMTSKNNSLSCAKKELGDDYSEDEIRLVRIKYLLDTHPTNDVGNKDNTDDLPF